MRTPAYQESILQCFEQHHLLSLAELGHLIPEADQSTLYRNITNLTEQGLLRAIVIDKHRTLYERADHQHDHLVCDDCGEVEAIDLPRPNTAGITITSLLAHGSCERCNQEQL